MINNHGLKQLKMQVEPLHLVIKFSHAVSKNVRKMQLNESGALVIIKMLLSDVIWSEWGVLQRLGTERMLNVQSFGIHWGMCVY